MSFKFYVVEEPWTGTTKLILIERSGEQTFALWQGERGIMRTKLSENDATEPPPFIRLDDGLAKHVFPALIEELSKKGFERPSESKLAGLYEAQSAHLKDLQTLVASLVLKRPIG